MRTLKSVPLIELREKMGESVTLHDLFDGMVYALTLQNRETFPYKKHDRRMVAAFVRLSDDIDELFSPLSVRNEVGPILADPIHGTSAQVESMINFAVFRVNILSLMVPGNGTLHIRCSADEAEFAFKKGRLPGNKDVYEELVRRLTRYYEESDVPV